MEGQISLKFDDFKYIIDTLKDIERKAPDLMKRKIDLAGRHFLDDVKYETLKHLKYQTNTATGNLVNGYKKKTHLKDGSFRSYQSDISGGNEKAFHFHLLEHGHRRYEQMFPRPGRVYESSQGFTEGYHMMQTVTDRWAQEYTLLDYAESAIDEAIRKGWI